MEVLYNDTDSFCNQWVRNLIDAGALPRGDVNERSIEDIRRGDLEGYRQAHFFNGIGGWPYALKLAGWGDREVWTGSCPCQPFSGAGQRQGASDQRHLWPAFFELIAECRPATIFGEQVGGTLGREWLAAVRADLEAIGYAVGGADLAAASVGAPHIRQRLFWVGNPVGEGLEGHAGHGDGGGEPRRVSQEEARSVAQAGWSDLEWLPCSDGKARPAQPGIRPLAHGFPGRVGRLRAYGNAVVPAVAAVFIRAWMERGEDTG